MIDLDRAAQAAEALGWTVERVGPDWIVARRPGCHVDLFEDYMVGATRLTAKLRAQITSTLSSSRITWLTPKTCGLLIWPR